jgi:hypothetical protein
MHAKVGTQGMQMQTGATRLPSKTNYHLSACTVGVVALPPEIHRCRRSALVHPSWYESLVYFVLSAQWQGWCLVAV